LQAEVGEPEAEVKLVGHEPILSQLPVGRRTAGGWSG